MTEQTRWKIGDLVYLAYSPVQCGKVVGIETREEISWEGKPFDTFYLQVKMLKSGEVITESVFSWRDFRALVEDHLRKFRKHNETLSKLETL